MKIVWFATMLALTLLPAAARGGEVSESAARLSAPGQEDGEPGMLVALIQRIDSARESIERALRSTDLEGARRGLEEAVGALGDDQEGAATLIGRALAEIRSISEQGLEGAAALRVDRIRTALDNTAAWGKAAVKHVGYGLKAPTAEGARLHAGHAAKWIVKMEQGFDANFNNRIESSEGGASMALELARRLSD